MYERRSAGPNAQLFICGVIADPARACSSRCGARKGRGGVERGGAARRASRARARLGPGPIARSAGGGPAPVFRTEPWRGSGKTTGWSDEGLRGWGGGLATAAGWAVLEKKEGGGDGRIGGRGLNVGRGGQIEGWVHLLEKWQLKIKVNFLFCLKLGSPNSNLYVPFYQLKLSSSMITGPEVKTKFTPSIFNQFKN